MKSKESLVRVEYCSGRTAVAMDWPLVDVRVLFLQPTAQVVG